MTQQVLIETLVLNNNTDRIFGVRTNAGTSNLFSVNESGNATFAGTISSGAITSSGNITLAEYLYHRDFIQ